MLEKAVHCLGLLHYGWAWNLALKMDGASSEAKPTALGYVFVPWFSTGTNSAVSVILLFEVLRFPLFDGPIGEFGKSAPDATQHAVVLAAVKDAARR